MHSNLDKLNELRWTKVPVLSDGFVSLVDCMGDDSDIVQAARVSFNADTRDDQDRLLKILKKSYKECPDPDNIGAYTPNQVRDAREQLVKDENKLLRMLMRLRHSTPFEQVELKFLIRVPMDAWRQGVRHRTASINEYSTRYTEAIDSRDVTPADGWRLQATANKQGSSGLLESWPKDVEGEWKYGKLAGEDLITPGEYLSDIENKFHTIAQKVYQERLKFGIAKEQARKDLPLSTYTELYWKCDLHNIFHFLGLRMDSHAQLEIRLYANAIASFVQQLFPVSYQAFLDYRLNAFTMTSLDCKVVQLVSKSVFRPSLDYFNELMSTVIEDKREQDECREKCARMGLFVVPLLDI